MPTDSSEENMNPSDEDNPESIIPFETELLGGHGGYYFVPIDGKTYRYKVADQWDAVYAKDSLIYQFDDSDFGEYHSYKIYSFSSFADHTYLSCVHTGAYGLEEELILRYSPALRSDDEELQRAIDSDFVIMENGSAVQGKDLWKEFYDNSSQGQPSVIRIGQYFTIEHQNMSEDMYEASKFDYPCLFLSQLEYDGTKYIMSPLHFQDGDYIVKEEETIDNPVTEWKYLLHFTGIGPSDALYTEYDRYVLCNKITTWEKIVHGMFSSQMNDYIPYTEAYNEYTWK